MASSLLPIDGPEHRILYRILAMHCPWFDLGRCDPSRVLEANHKGAYRSDGRTLVPVPTFLKWKLFTDSEVCEILTPLVHIGSLCVLLVLLLVIKIDSQPMDCK